MTTTSGVREETVRPTILYLVTHEFSSYLFRGQLDHVAAAGFDVVVGCGTDDGQPSRRFDSSARTFALPYTREPSPLGDVRALVRTIQAIRRIRPDVVNVSTPKASVIGAISAYVCRVPNRVWVVRGFRFETTGGMKRRLLRSLDVLAARCSTAVIFNSPSLRTFAVSEGVVQPGVGGILGCGSGNGVDVDRYAQSLPRGAARRRFGVPDEAPVLGFVGRLTRDKGIEDTLAVFDDVRSDYPGTRLLLLGQFESGDPLPIAVAERIESDPDVVFHDWVEDPSDVYRAMDVLIFPSRREGLPNVPMEAQSSGTPVVGYAATGTVDAVENGVGGVLVTVGDRRALSAATLDLMGDQRTRDLMGAAGSAWVAARFARSLVWSDLVALYREWIGACQVTRGPEVSTGGER